MQASARLSSSAASKKVIAGVSSAITRSSYQTSRGKAHAAPLSVQEPPPKAKRVNKQDRKIKIVEFVDKFRASNDGKFPTITNVRQQVGGGHYTVREVLQELMYNHTKSPLGNAKAAPLQRTVEVAEYSGPKDEAMEVQHKGKPEFDERIRVSFNNSQEMQDVDDVLISKKDAATSIGIVEKTETWISVGSSHHNVETDAAKHDLNEAMEVQHKGKPEFDELLRVSFNNSQEMQDVDDVLISQKDAATSIGIVEKTETEAAKHDLKNSGTFKTADDRTLSDQTESESMKVIMNKSSVSLGVGAKSDPENQRRETEANKLSLENKGKPLNSSESSVSDQSGNDKVIKANEHDREHNKKHEADESTSTGLFGSLKSFAYGFRNFWKKL